MLLVLGTGYASSSTGSPRLGCASSSREAVRVSSNVSELAAHAVMQPALLGFPLEEALTLTRRHEFMSRLSLALG